MLRNAAGAKARRRIVEEIHRYPRQNFVRRKVSMRGIADTVQADLIEMPRFRGANRGYRYILIAIDIFSKKAYAEPLRFKRANNVVPAMEIVLKKIGQPIRNLHTADGNL